MKILIDLAVTLIMAFWVYLSMGLPFSMLFLVCSILFMAKAEEVTPTSSIYSKLFAVASDLFGLGVTVFLNYVLELFVKVFAKLFQAGGEGKARLAEDIDMANKADGVGKLDSLKESLESDADKFQQNSTELTQYNDVFFGLNAIETTLLAYVVARTIFIVYYFTRRK